MRKFQDHIKSLESAKDSIEMVQDMLRTNPSFFVGVASEDASGVKNQLFFAFGILSDFIRLYKK